MKIFISWSKDKSRNLAMATKELIKGVIGEGAELFFSPDMYKGTCVDNRIHSELLSSDKCIVCITAENFKNPWLMYEAGVVYGSCHHKPGNSGIIIPILFEHIPEWSSWVDKPLNRYVPVHFKRVENTYNHSKNEFKKLLEEMADEAGTGTKNFTKCWNKYVDEVDEILQKEQLIPDTCKDLVNQLMSDNDENFTITSPEITKEHILFHKGFATTALIKLLLGNVVNYQGKRLWIYGRRNKKLMTSENDPFFYFLANEGIKNGVDFKCLFPLPKSEAVIKAVGSDKERQFQADLQSSLEAALKLRNKFNFPVEDVFRLYCTRRTDSIIVSDNALLHGSIICDGNGYPHPMTNTQFEILAIESDCPNSKGKEYFNMFKDAWEKAVPLTKDLYDELYEK